MKKEDIHKELQSIAPHLAAQKKKATPFKIPDNYFEQFENQLMEKRKEVTLTPPTTKVRQLSYWLIRAAAILVLATGALLFFQKNTPSTDNLLADITTSELNQYLAENIHDFDEELLFEKGLFKEDLLEEDFSDTEIDLYLEEHLEDLEEEDLDNLL